MISVDIGLAVGIALGVMGIGAFIKNNIESRKREKQLQQQIKELTEVIKKGQQIEFEQLILKQKRAIQNANNSIWIFGINALGVFHEQLEDMISFLKRKGNIKVLLLDPDSEAFKTREKIEEDTAGRLKAEYMTSLAYCKELIKFKGKRKGTIELRLHHENLNEALLIIDPHTDNVNLHVNSYPNQKHTRGYIGQHRTISKENPDLIRPYIDKYETIWSSGKKVDL
jgi:hypothetical protein